MSSSLWRCCVCAHVAVKNKHRGGGPNKSSGATSVELLRGLKRGPPEIIVFYVGGATYAEARVVEKFNKDNRHCRVVLGGTCFLSTATFLESVAARAAGSWAVRGGRGGAQ